MLKPPRDRKEFDHEWDEIRYLYSKAQYWLHYRKLPTRGEAFVARLKMLTLRHDPNHEALLGVESMALIMSFEDDMAKEIYFVKRFIEMLMGALGETWPDMPNYDWSDVSDEMEILATLYADNDQLDLAMETVNACSALCRKQNIPFDEEALRKHLLS